MLLDNARTIQENLKRVALNVGVNAFASLVAPFRQRAAKDEAYIPSSIGKPIVIPRWMASFFGVEPV